MGTCDLCSTEGLLYPVKKRTGKKKEKKLNVCASCLNNNFPDQIGTSIVMIRGRPTLMKHRPRGNTDKLEEGKMSMDDMKCHKCGADMDKVVTFGQIWYQCSACGKKHVPDDTKVKKITTVLEE